MKFSVSSSDLLKQLQAVYGALASNPVIPILEDFLFKIENSVLTIIGTDLETYITTQLEVSSDTSAEVCIPAKILMDTVKALPNQPITFNIAFGESAISIEVTSAYGKYKVAGEKAVDFPQLPHIEESRSLWLNSYILQKGIATCLFATSNDELRPAMTGVYFQADANNLTFVATDGHKLVKYAFSDVKSDVYAHFIVPKKPLGVLKNILPQNTEVALTYTKGYAKFQFENTCVYCRLTDAKFPDYNNVIPVDNPIKASFGRMELIQSLKRIAIYGNKSTYTTVLDFSDKSLTVSSQDVDFSLEATEQLHCSLDGEGIRLGFNIRFLGDALSVMEGEEVFLELSTPMRPGILRPVEKTEGEYMLILIMPVMIAP